MRSAATHRIDLDGRLPPARRSAGLKAVLACIICRTEARDACWIKRVWNARGGARQDLFAALKPVATLLRDRRALIGANRAASHRRGLHRRIHGVLLEGSPRRARAFSSARTGLPLPQAIARRLLRKRRGAVQHWPIFGTQAPTQPMNGTHAPTQHFPEPQQSDCVTPLPSCRADTERRSMGLAWTGDFMTATSMLALTGRRAVPCAPHAGHQSGHIPALWPVDETDDLTALLYEPPNCGRCRRSPAALRSRPRCSDRPGWYVAHSRGRTFAAGRPSSPSRAGRSDSWPP